MKTRVLLFIFCFPLVLMSQEWVKNLPADKAQQGELTFLDIQKAFNDFNTMNGIVGGKQLINGQLGKVPGWKQFKRWEYYWESRVNPITGEFPKTSAAEEFTAYLKNSQSGKSNSGTWTAVGPSSSDGGYAGIGRVNCIAFHPTDNNTFWIGTPAGGLWKTTDGGNSWSVLTDGNSVLGVSDIAIPSDYATSNTIYIATGDRDGGSVWSLGGGNSNDNNSIGVLKSIDGGVTWVATGLTYTVSQNKLVGRLLIHPTNTNLLLAGTSDGIKKSVDGGTNWTSEYTGTYIIDMEFKPGDPTVIYASNKDYWGVARIMKSIDSGDNWTITKNFADTDYRVEIAVTPNDAEYIYCIVANRNSGLTGIYKSTDGGATFTQKVNGDNTNKAYLYYYSDGSGDNSGQGSYDLSIAVSPTDKNRVIIGGVNAWKTTDGGTNWSICNMWTSYSGYNFSGAPEVHADKHVHSFRGDGTLFEGNDGGIYKSIDNGTSWTDLSNGMVISQIYRLGVSQTDFNMTINGLQDNGSKLADGSIWSDVTGGDGMECIIDFTDKNIQYATYVEGEIYRTTNLWASSTTISDNIIGGSAGAWVTPYIIDPNNHNTLYVGYADVWKTTDKGNTFTKISTMNSSDKLRSMAIAASNSNYIFVADPSKIWKTSNGGTLWTNITGTLPVTSNDITYVAVDITNENTIWVTMGGYNTQRVYESTNGGTSWTNISSGLPNLPVMCLVQNKLSTPNKQLYVGTDVGVYVKNGSGDWQLFSQGLPNVVVTELDIYYNTATPESSKIRAASFGRGLWESDLYSIPELPPLAGFTASSVTIQQGALITFTDTSANEPTTWEWTFLGGSPETATVQNPQVNYNTIGVFDVTLVVTNSAGNDTLTKTGYITVNAAVAPVAGFTASSTVIQQGELITFTDTSIYEPSAWEWIFAGGTPATSALQNPQVVYNTAGIFDVTLVATNIAGNDTVTHTAYITVNAGAVPVTGFTASATTIQQGEIITFTDTSALEPTSWEWTFAGGTPTTSTLQNPPIVYNTPGTYNVTLVTANIAGSDTLEKVDYIIVTLPEVVADFTATPLSGDGPLEVTFSNNSLNASSYVWDFGDTQTSTELNPVHTFATAGLFTVKLTASNADYSDEVEKVDYINVTQPEVVASFTANPQLGSFPLSVNFTNNTINATAYLWDFGDTQTSEVKNPVHTYLNAGLYTVALIASKDGFADTLIKSNYIEAVWPMPVAKFGANPTSGNEPLMVVFSDLSDFAQQWNWNFGDGNSSSVQNPEYSYAKGTYTVTLQVTNPSGSHSLIKENLIVVDPNSLPEEWKEVVQVFPNPATDKIIVNITNEKLQPVVIELFDIAGKRVYNETPNISQKIEETIQVEPLEKGNYLMKLSIGEQVMVLKIAVE